MFNIVQHRVHHICCKLQHAVLEKQADQLHPQREGDGRAVLLHQLDEHAAALRVTVVKHGHHVSLHLHRGGLWTRVQIGG